MKAIRVKIQDAERVRKQLINAKVLAKTYRVKHDNKYVYFPILKKVKGYSIIQKRFEMVKPSKSLKESLQGQLTKKEMEKVKTSMEVVGDIAILEIPKELLGKKKIVAEALLASQKNIKTVVKKVGGYGGVFRLREFQYLAGRRNFKTTHRESGARFILDIRNTYFSARLGSERLRIAKQIKKDENVLVLFSGIGVYPIIFSKHSQAKEIVGVEINPDACEYGEGNVILNKIKNVRLFCGDVREVVPHLGMKFDRILLPLPSHAEDFFPLLRKIAKKGAIVHYYTFEEEGMFPEARKRVKNSFPKSRIRRVVKCGQPKPRTFRICLDFTI